MAEETSDEQSTEEAWNRPPLTGFLGTVARVGGSFFYVGHLPKFPGTWATAVAGVMYAAMLGLGAANHWSILGLAVGFSLLSLLLAPWAERAYGRKDPGNFVLDEFAGYFVTLLFLPSYSVAAGLAAFAAFRVFDIFKPPPAAQLERVGGGAGILLDDLAAGVYANLTVRLVLHILGL